MAAASVASVRQRNTPVNISEPTAPPGASRTPGVQPLGVKLRQRAAPYKARERREADRLAIGLVLGSAYASWFVCIALGCYHYDGAPPPKNAAGSVLVFFDLLFRTCGALLPFSVLAFRAVAHYIFQGRAFPEGVEQRNIVFVYVGMTLVRAAVYNWLLWAVAPRQLMSDHIFLAACILSQLVAEGCILLQIMRGPRSSPAMRYAAGLALGTTGVYVALTCGEVLKTAAHYHPLEEVAVATAAGWMLFQFPIAWWLLRYLPQSPHF